MKINDRTNQMTTLKEKGFNYQDNAVFHCQRKTDQKISYYQVANLVVDNAFSTQSVTKIFETSVTPKVWLINSKYSRAYAIVISVPCSSYLYLRLGNNFDH